MKEWSKTLNRILECVGDAMILAFGAFSAFIFWQILVVGSIKFIEPNSIILKCELALACLIVLLGLERTGKDLVRLVRYMRRNKEGGET